MGDASFNKGGVAARNLKAGVVNVSGGSTSVSFDRPMKNEPEVVATALADENVYVTAKSQTGFTLNVTGGGTANVSWMAFNDDRA